MTERANVGDGANQPMAVRLLPGIVGVIGAAAAAIVALVVGRPIPFDLVAALLALGLATAWIARAAPLRGALFVAILTMVVFGVGYSG